MHLQPVFSGCRIRGGDVAESLFECGLCLPSGSSLTDDDRMRIVETIRAVAIVARRGNLYLGSRVSQVGGSLQAEGRLRTGRLVMFHFAPRKSRRSFAERRVRPTPQTLKRHESRLLHCPPPNRIARRPRAALHRPGDVLLQIDRVACAAPTSITISKGASATRSCTIRRHSGTSARARCLKPARPCKG